MKDAMKDLVTAVRVWLALRLLVAAHRLIPHRYENAGVAMLDLAQTVVADLDAELGKRYRS